MVTRNYDLKTAQDYIDYLDKLGFNEKYYDYLNDCIECINCYNKTINKNVSLNILMDEDYREELLKNPSEEVEADFNRFKVTAIAIDSHITSEENYFDGSTEHIYLVNKEEKNTSEDYYTHNLSLFKYVMSMFKDKGVSHEFYILQQHIKHLEWINSVLTPVLLKADYFYDGSDIFSIKEGSRVDSNLCVYFKRPNCGYKNDFWAGTDCITGEFICEERLDIFGKTQEELWDFLMENYWKADNAKYNFEIGEFTYPYTEGQDINTYHNYMKEISDLRWGKRN